MHVKDTFKEPIAHTLVSEAQMLHSLTRACGAAFPQPHCVWRRYQIIAGVIEERGIERVFKDNKQMCNLLSLVVRTANTFVGSLLWVDFLRYLGLQSVGGH